MSMPIGRMAPHLQGAAEIRRWTVKNIPFADTMVGYDLFMKIGNDLVTGIPLTPDNLARDLPHTGRQIRLQLMKLIQAGLLVPQAASGRSAPGKVLLATTRLLGLLEAYAEVSDHVYALRKNLRRQQLLVQAPDTELGHFAELMYDHFLDLGWVYLHNYGAICFLMATLVRNVARLHGYRAETMSGYVEVFRASDGHLFKLGGQAEYTPGQIAGHAFCVVNESMIVDFGLGNLRRYYDRHFQWGLVGTHRPLTPVQGGLVLPSGDTVAWKNDWCYPDTVAEFAKFKNLAASLAEQYRQHFGVPALGAPGPHVSAPPAAADSEALPLDALGPPPPGASGAARPALR